LGSLFFMVREWVRAELLLFEKGRQAAFLVPDVVSFFSSVKSPFLPPTAVLLLSFRRGADPFSPLPSLFSSPVVSSFSVFTISPAKAFSATFSSARTLGSWLLRETRP